MNVAALNFSTREFAKIFGSTKKRTTFNLSENNSFLSEVVLMCDKRPTKKLAEITEIRIVRFGSVTQKVAWEHGYESINDLKAELVKKYNKSVNNCDVVSLIRFELEGD